MPQITTRVSALGRLLGKRARRPVNTRFPNPTPSALLAIFSSSFFAVA